MQGATFDPPTSPPGYPRTLSRSRKPYTTKDGGVIAVLPYNDGQWRRLFEAVGKGRMLREDPRFADIGARTANIDALYDMVGEEVAQRTLAEWLELLPAIDVPHMVPHTLESLMADPHLEDRGFFRMADHPSEGRIRTMREPSTWSGTPPPEGGFAPRLGQHTREVLAEAGYAEAEIEAMIAAGVAMTDARG
jgi:crotonobetainyl-CoA:carnitine CoA-transferase CaiB-like acyl-CoA transferase